jgi:outer membrane receptor for ferrienterochelin and colicins
MNKNAIFLNFLTILLVATTPQLAIGQSNGPIDNLAQDEELFALSLTELGNITVSVASTHDETILETPAIVSRYEMTDMAKMGLGTLKEVLSFIPGVVVNDIKSGATSVMIRGLYEAYNQKVLFLLDDVPYWMPSHGDIPLLGIPIEGIDHIEVIRGPGAIFYGTNASAGVIKVVTRKHDVSQITVKGGSDGLINTSGYYHQQFNSGTKLNIAFEGQNDDGYHGLFESGPETISKAYETKSLLVQLNHKEFNFLGQAFNSTTNGILGPKTINNHSDLDYDGYLLHVDNTFKLDDAEIKVFTDYNNFYLDYDVNSLGMIWGSSSSDGGFRFDDPQDNYRWRGGATVGYYWSEQLKLFGGVEIETRSTSEFQMQDDTTDTVKGAIIPAARIDESSLYGQVDYIKKKWRFIVGGRYTDNDLSGDSFAPRLATVYNIDAKQSLKLMYSEGFNVPNFIQQFAGLGGLAIANRNLTAETVKTTDFAYTYASGETLFVANVFYLRAEDFIQRSFPNGVITFIQGEPFERYGGELDFQRNFDDWRLFTNLAYHKQGNSDDDTTSTFAPRLTTSTGLSYEGMDYHSIGGSLRSISSRGKGSELLLLNLNYQYHPGKYEIFATVKNVLDEVILNPDVEDSTELVIPGGAGRSLLVGLKAYF